jgi:hypothetical protein
MENVLQLSKRGELVFPPSWHWNPPLWWCTYKYSRTATGRCPIGPLHEALQGRHADVGFTAAVPEGLWRVAAGPDTAAAPPCLSIA